MRDVTEHADNVLELPRRGPEGDLAHHVRLVEALLFASAEPLEDAVLRDRLPPDADLARVMECLGEHYRGRGVQLVRVAKGWAFRTAPDLTAQLRIETPVVRKLSRAAVETLAIVAYHQPVTRAEIESIRGVATSKGTLDTLMEAGWIRPGRRRMTPGRPLTWVTTKGFLDHFGLASIDELPGVEELKAAGLLDSRPAITTLPGGRAEELTGEDQDDTDDRESF
jgi:segregation and condensation protein B